MPIYEYRCLNCSRRTSLLVMNVATFVVPPCPRCATGSLQKLMSRFAVVRSEESRLDDLADPGSFGDIDENDPKSIARWARRMGQEMGEDLGDDFDQMVDQLEAGEVPDDVGESGIGQADDGQGF
jgi:putative FmdB family regulatory protein